MNLDLSPAQQKTLAAALTMGGIIFIGAITLLVLIGCLLLIQQFSNVFFPLAVSGILALLLKPYYAWWLKRTKQRRVISVILVYTSVGIPVLAAVTAVAVPLISEVSSLLAHIPQWMETLEVYLQQNLPEVSEFWQNYNLTEKLQGVFRQHTGTLSQGMQSLSSKALSAGAGIFQFFTSLFSWLVVPIYVTFLLVLRPVSAARIEERVLPFLKPETRGDVAYLAREFCNIVVAFFRGQLLIALCQGVLFAVGFTLAGLQYGILLGFLAGLLNIIPYLGSLVGAGLTLPLAFFQADGGIWTLIWVLVAFIVVQAIEGNFLTPRIMGNRTGLHPLVIIIAVLFWGSVFGGILGMILAIPLTAFLAVFWRLLREKYFKEVV
ncbi:MAG: AI-2E family transporter [Lentisphaeria bacterium]